MISSTRINAIAIQMLAIGILLPFSLSELGAAEQGNPDLEKAYVASRIAGGQFNNNVFLLSGGEVGNEDGTYSDAKWRGPASTALVSGSLFVVDKGNRTLRKIELANGRTSSIDAQGAVSDPGAIVAKGDQVIVSDLATGHIVVLDPRSGEKSVLRDNSGSEISFDRPTGLALAISRDEELLLVADEGRGAVFAVSLGVPSQPREILRTKTPPYGIDYAEPQGWISSVISPFSFLVQPPSERRNPKQAALARAAFSSATAPVLTSLARF
jgi:hypothetical protein